MDKLVSDDAQTRRFDCLVDARGLSCPMPLVKARQAIAVLDPGQSVAVLATDPAAPRDFEDYAEASGHEMIESREEDAVFLIVMRKSA